MNKLLDRSYILALLASAYIPVLLFFRSSPPALIYVAVVLGCKGLDWGQFRAFIWQNRFVQAFFALLIYGIVSSTWAEFPVLSLKASLAISALGVAGVLFYHLYSSATAKLNPLFIAMSVIFIVILPVVMYDATHQMHIINSLKIRLVDHISFFSRLSVCLPFFIWPLLWRMSGKDCSIKERLLIGLAIIFAVATVLVLENAASKMVMIVGAVLFAVSYIMPRILAWIICLVTLMYLGFAPFVHKSIDSGSLVMGKVSSKFFSFDHRLYIWEFVSEQTMERPLIGNGFDAMRKEHDLGDIGQKWASFKARHVNPYAKGSLDIFDPPFHAHNLTLQIWYELGAVGVISLGLMMIFMTINIAQLKLQNSRAGMVNATLAGLIMIMHSSFCAWQSWWFATVIFIVTFVGCALRSGRV